MNKLQLAMDKLDVKRRELAAIFEDAGPEMDISAEAAEDIKQRNAELEELGAEVKNLREVADIEAKNRSAIEESNRATLPVGFSNGAEDGAPKNDAPRKSLGELFVESAGYKDFQATGRKQFGAVVPHDVKTLMAESGTGFAPQAIRTGVVVPSAQQMPKIVDLIPSTTTTMVAVKYMAETTYTNNAAEVAEGNTYGEAALGYTEETSPVEKIGVFIPVTDEQLADVEGMQDRINNRLTLMIRQRLDSQLVNGNGTSPNLTGYLNTSGIQTQAHGTDSNVDAIYKAIVKIQSVAFADPNAVLLNPTDWQNIRLLRTADGVYVFGYPGDVGVPQLWGLPVVTSTFVPAGTGLVADFAGYTEISYRAGLEFEVSNSHSDFFTRGQLAIRCQLRAASIVYRAAAICEVSGLTTA